MNKQNKPIPSPPNKPPSQTPTLTNEHKLKMLEEMLENTPNDKIKQSIEQEIIELKNLLNNE